VEFNNLPNKVRQKESDGIMGQGFPPNINTAPLIYTKQQVGNLSSLTKKSRAETKLIAFTFKTKQKVTKKLF
jgi:hypothetical protein